MSTRRKFLLFNTLLIGGFIFALLLHLRYLTYFEWTFWEFLSDRWVWFVDLKYQLASAPDLNPYRSGRLDGYFPFSYLLFFALGKLSTITGGLPLELILSFSFWALALGVMWGLQAQVWRYSHLGRDPLLWGSSLLALVLFYPALFALRRGNIDLLLVAALGICLWPGRSKSPPAAFSTVTFATLPALKPQLGIFWLPLILKDGILRVLPIAAVFTVLTTAALLLFPGPLGENLAGLWAVQKQVDEVFVLKGLGIPYGHSPFNLVVWFRLLTRWHLSIATLRSAYTLFSLLGLSAIAWVGWRARTRLSFNTLALLFYTASLVFTPWSYDYKLLYLLPLVLLEMPELTRWQVVLFALLFLPKHYFPYSFSGHPQTISSVLNPICLLLIFVSLVRAAAKPARAA